MVTFTWVTLNSGPTQTSKRTYAHVHWVYFHLSQREGFHTSICNMTCRRKALHCHPSQGDCLICLRLLPLRFSDNKGQCHSPHSPPTHPLYTPSSQPDPPLKLISLKRHHPQQLCHHVSRQRCSRRFSAARPARVIISPGSHSCGPELHLPIRGTCPNSAASQSPLTVRTHPRSSHWAGALWHSLPIWSEILQRMTK